VAVTPLHAAVASLLGASLFGVWIAVERASAWFALAWVVAGVLVYAVVVRAARDERRWRWVASVLIGTGAMGALCVALQYRYLGYPAKSSLVTSIGELTSACVPALGLWSPFPNSLATWLEGLLPLAFGLTRSRGATRGARAVARAAFALIALGVLLSASRGAWIAEAVAFAAWAFVACARRRPGWLEAGALVLAASLVAVTIGSLVAGPAAVAETTGWSDWLRPDRLDVYRHSLSLVRDFPFSGIGLGDQFAMALSRQALLIQVPFLTYPHNLLLNQWLEGGLPGALAWVSVVAAVIGCGLAGARAALGRGFRGASLGALAIIVHGLSDARQSVDGWTWLPLFALVALMAARLQAANIPLTRANRLASLLAPLALVVIVVLAYWPIDAAWQANVGGVWELRGYAADLSADGRADARRAAEAAYQQAVRLDPRQATARRRLGILSMQDGRYSEALAHLQIASEAAPDNWTTRKALGLAYVWTGDTDRAVGLLASLDDPTIAGELDAWAHWRQTRGEMDLARRAAEVSARLRDSAVHGQKLS
jgi:O-antigen ligase